MKTYIGCKIIQAELFVRDGAPGYRVVYPDGYTSWSPKDVFEKAYRLVDDDEAAFLKPKDLDTERDSFYNGGVPPHWMDAEALRIAQSMCDITGTKDVVEISRVQVQLTEMLRKLSGR